MKTALITHEECLNHITPPGHPEQVARLEYIVEALKPLDLNRVTCLLYTSPSPRDYAASRMPSSA